MQQNRVFVTKIASELKEDDIRQYFEGFGRVCDFYMPMTNGAQHKGMAFLSFEEAVDKELILQNAPHQILGYEVVVDDAKPMNSKSESSRSEGYGADPYGSWWDDPWLMKGWGGGKGGGGHSSSASHESDGGGGSGRVSNRVFVTRISEELTKEDLEAYFCQFGELTDIFVPLKNPNSDAKDQAHKGIAFVSFKDKDTYEEVLSRDKYEIKPNVFIVVDKAAGKEPRYGGGKGGKGKSSPWGMMKGKGKFGGKWGDYWGTWDDWDWWSSWGPPRGMMERGGKGMMDRWGPY
ncbi:unnamed protein product [Amoebophrya sp. A25]|nr:unnamed protein product [Amoebophrya sp. A25]|eukprot:GSA25T00011387001.1